MAHQQDCHRSAQAYKSNDSSSSLRYVHELRVDRIAARDVLQSSYQIVRPLHQTDRLTLRRTGVTQAGSRSARPNAGPTDTQQLACCCCAAEIARCSRSRLAA